jgi:DNA-binding MarR family transcriptional regulator
MPDDPSELTVEDQALLAQVQQLGAATAIELAVKTLRQPDKVRPELERLHQAGLLKVRQRDSDYERNIYLLTQEGRQYADLAGPLRQVDE